MKKELLKQFETIVRGHIGEFYARAYAAKGNRAEAEALTVDAIVWGASKFSGLAKKERVVDLIVARIGHGKQVDMEYTNEENMISRTMERIRSKGKLKSLVWGVVSCVLVLAILAVTLPRLPYDEWFPEETTTQTDAEGNVIQPVIGAVTMKKTDTIKGDNGAIMLENYHNLSNALDKKTVCFDGYDARSKLDRYTATATAPDGTAYLVFTDIPKKKTEENNTATLYRMEKDGWKALGSFEVQVNYSSNPTMGTTYQSSRIYMETDEDSNVYIFFMMDKSVCIYRYDAKTGEFVKSEASIYTGYKPMIQFTFKTFYDASVGEKGVIYIGTVNMSSVDFSYYDIATDTIVPIVKNVATSASHRIFCAEDGVIHMAVTANYGISYYRIDSDGKVQKKVLSTGELYGNRETIAYTGSGAGGIAVDEDGTVHILTTHTISESGTIEIVHYVICEDMSFEREVLPKLYYTDASDYRPACGGLIQDENGDIYYIEIYNDYASSGNVFAVGRLGENFGDAPVCIDVVEMTESVNAVSFLRITGNTVVFFAKNDIYYFHLKGIGG